MPRRTQQTAAPVEQPAQNEAAQTAGQQEETAAPIEEQATQPEAAQTAGGNRSAHCGA